MFFKKFELIDGTEVRLRIEEGQKRKNEAIRERAREGVLRQLQKAARKAMKDTPLFGWTGVEVSTEQLEECDYGLTKQPKECNFGITEKDESFKGFLWDRGWRIKEEKSQKWVCEDGEMKEVTTTRLMIYPI